MNKLSETKNIVGNKYSDLILETLGKIYIKTGNKSEVLDNLIQRLILEADSPKTILVNSESEMIDMKYPGDGAFIYNKLTDSLYMALDNRYILIVSTLPENSPQYVNKDGDTMTGLLEIRTDGVPLIVYSSQLVKNLNVEYLNNYSSNDFAKKKINEVIYGNWSFEGLNTAYNNWIFKEDTRFFKDIVTSGSLSSPQFMGGFGGYGWRLDANTNTLTVDNIVVRKAMLVYELVINQISATNGSLWVSNATTVENVYRPYLITKEELELANKGTKEEIEAKLNNILFNNSYFLITDTLFTINRDTNNLGVLEEEDIGTVTESESLSSASNINTTPKEFVNFKYIIWIGDLNKILEDSEFRVEYFYDENYLFNINENPDLRVYYLSKKILVTEWNEDNTPKVFNYVNTFNKNLEIFIIPRDTDRVVGLKPYYKYFALSKDVINRALMSHVEGDKKVPVPTLYIIDSDSSMNPTLKPGDLVRCLKFEDNNIKYYDAVVTAQFKSKSYILQKAASVFDTYTEISYNDDGSVKSKTEYDNTVLYNLTEKTYNPDTGEYEYNYPTTEKVADVAKDDDIILMGNIYDSLRLNAIYITSTDDCGPYIDILADVNRPDYSVIYDLYKYEKKSLPLSKKGDIYVKEGLSDWYYQYERPLSINEIHKPSFIGNNEKYPIVFIKISQEVGKNHYIIYINDEIPEDTSAGYFITEHPTRYSIFEKNSKGGALIKNNQSTKIRLGNLDGIYNETFGNRQPHGFGLYGENVFLTGEFYLNNGKSVVNFSIDEMILKFAESGISIKEKDYVHPEIIENGKPKSINATEITLSAEKVFIKDDLGENTIATFISNKAHDAYEGTDIHLAANKIICPDIVIGLLVVILDSDKGHLRWLDSKGILRAYNNYFTLASNKSNFRLDDGRFMFTSDNLFPNILRYGGTINADTIYTRLVNWDTKITGGEIKLTDSAGGYTNTITFNKITLMSSISSSALLSDAFIMNMPNSTISEVSFRPYRITLGNVRITNDFNFGQYLINNFRLPVSIISNYYLLLNYPAIYFVVKHPSEWKASHIVLPPAPASNGYIIIIVKAINKDFDIVPHSGERMWVDGSADRDVVNLSYALFAIFVSYGGIWYAAVSYKY